jgi:hypothetical protein
MIRRFLLRLRVIRPGWHDLSLAERQWAIAINHASRP